MPTEPIAGLPYPAPSATDAPQVDLQALAVATAPKLVNVYASASARDAAITSPTAGMRVWLTSPGRFSFYTGSAWADEGALFGEKLIARDGGTGQTGAGVGTYVTIPARGFTSPFGTGVPYMIKVTGAVMFDGTVAYSVSAGVTTGAVPGQSEVGTDTSSGGRRTIPISDIFVVSGGGSITLTVYVKVNSGTATWYTDGKVTYANWVASPLAS